jgi:hypothetical protein
LGKQLLFIVRTTWIIVDTLYGQNAQSLNVEAGGATATELYRIKKTGKNSHVPATY